MKGKYVNRIGGLVLALLMLVAISFVSASTAEAQTRRTVIVRPFPVRVYRPFRYHYWYNPYGWGYDPWSPYGYGSYYGQYVFDNSEDAVTKGYKDGFKTGKDDGKKTKSYDPQRSHYYHDAGFGNYADVYRSGFSRGYRDGYRVGTNQWAG